MHETLDIVSLYQHSPIVLWEILMVNHRWIAQSMMNQVGFCIWNIALRFTTVMVFRYRGMSVAAITKDVKPKRATISAAILSMMIAMVPSMPRIANARNAPMIWIVETAQAVRFATKEFVKFVPLDQLSVRLLMGSHRDKTTCGDEVSQREPREKRAPRTAHTSRIDIVTGTPAGRGR